MGVRIPVPRSIAAEVRTLSATGFTKQGVAQHFGVSLPTFNRWLDEDTELQEAFNSGREDERQSLHNALYRKAMNGDTVASIFLLKSRHQYRENDQSNDGNKVAITFNLPGALKTEQYVVGSIEGTLEDGESRASAKRVPNALALDTRRV